MMRTSHSAFGSEIEVRRAPSPPRRASDHPVGRLANRREILRAREWGHDKHLRFGATVVLPSGSTRSGSSRPWHRLLEGRCLNVADYVTGIEARDRATAAGWRSCRLSSRTRARDPRVATARSGTDTKLLSQEAARLPTNLARGSRIGFGCGRVRVWRVTPAAASASPRPLLSTELRTVKVEVQLFTPRLRPSRRARAVHGS